MFTKSQIGFLALSILSASEEVLGRERWLERNNRAVLLNPRRFGQEHPAVIDKLGAACPGQVCGVLSGAAITPLLAAQGECTQQDMADQIIDAAAQFDAATQANMIQLAIEYRQVEKNTPPDFTTNPPTNRNSVFCQKAPKNSQLNGLVQAQDPANDPNIFFDPALQASVTKGSQANTFPFGTDGSTSSSNSSDTSSASVASSSAATSTVSTAASKTQADEVPCQTSIITVTVTSTSSVASTTAAAATASATAITAASNSSIGNFGSCTVPQIEFGVGFDNRKETSFQPVDQTSYNHGSAQNIDIITQFICDTLTNSCGADAAAKATCASAKSAADTGAAKTGVQADLFNAVFGITTNFAAVASVDDVGNIVPGTGSSSASSASTTAAASTSTATAVVAASNSSIGDFGSCTVPQIEFGVGFDNRKETSFEPVDKTSYNHGSAQGIDIITQFICDTLTNSCGADATAKATCASAKAAADTGAAKTGAQADLFNAVFGITTNFAAVASVDDQGNIIAGTGSSSSTAASSASGASATAGAASSSSIGDFGSCTVPQIEFGVGFDNRKETSFEPVDKTSYNHGSAQGIDIITQFICDTLTNSCGADATAKATCASAKAAADTGAAKTGAQADLFNAVFGITTNFAAVASVDDQGNVIAGTGSSTGSASSDTVSATATSDASVSVAATTSTNAAATSTATASSTSGNLQTFTGALGGVTAPAVTDLGNGQFQVDGNSAFNNEQNALVRSCDVQHNKCANAANASGNQGDLTVDACGTQQTQCNAVATA